LIHWYFQTDRQKSCRFLSSAAHKIKNSTSTIAYHIVFFTWLQPQVYILCILDFCLFRPCLNTCQNRVFTCKWSLIQPLIFLSQNYFAFLIFFISVICRIQLTYYFTPTSNLFHFTLLFHNTKMELELTQRLTFCAACCCIVYWTFKWFWICEIISGYNTVQLRKS
jgi:hypothetical protein